MDLSECNCTEIGSPFTYHYYALSEHYNWLRGVLDTLIKSSLSVTNILEGGWISLGNKISLVKTKIV
jgi:hypothetical protein